MKTITIAALLTIGSLRLGAQAPALAPGPEVPQIVLAGFKAYETTNARAALVAWLEGSPVSNPATIEQMLATLGPIEGAYGTIVGHEIVRVVSVSPSVRQVYGIIRYERGPLFVSFQCYRAGKDWIIPMLLSNTRITEVFPASLLGS